MVFIRYRSDTFVASSEQSLDIALVTFFCPENVFYVWWSLEIFRKCSHHPLRNVLTNNHFENFEKVVAKYSLNVGEINLRFNYKLICRYIFFLYFIFFSKFLKQIDYSLENTWAAASGRKNLFDSIGSWRYFQKAVYKCVPNKFFCSVSDISFYRYWACLH